MRNGDLFELAQAGDEVAFQRLVEPFRSQLHAHCSGAPQVESVWVEPYPDEMLGPSEDEFAPGARYEQRESSELAFVAALQHLPG